MLFDCMQSDINICIFMLSKVISVIGLDPYPVSKTLPQIFHKSNRVAMFSVKEYFIKLFCDRIKSLRPRKSSAP